MAIERYATNDDGFRKYVEMMETTPVGKRQSLLNAARAENARFIEAVEKSIITFDKILKLSEGELAEVIGAPGQKVEVLACAILSATDENLRANMVKMVPKHLAVKVQMQMRDFPQPQPAEVGSAKLAMIQTARALEKAGKLHSLKIPCFGEGYFQRKVA